MRALSVLTKVIGIGGLALAAEAQSVAPAVQIQAGPATVRTVQQMQAMDQAQPRGGPVIGKELPFRPTMDMNAYLAAKAQANSRPTGIKPVQSAARGSSTTQAKKR